MIESEDEARNYCRGIAGDAGIERLEMLAAMLRAENERQNLISAASMDQLWQRHIADSLQLLQHVPRETEVWLDLGTGAGFPGLAVALARPEIGMRLVESRRRRTDWLQSVIDAADLAQCQIFQSRLENVETFPAGVISARAFAPLERLLRLSARFSTPDTVWLLPKGRAAVQELQEQPKRVAALFHVEQSCTDPASGILIGRGAPKIR